MAHSMKPWSIRLWKHTGAVFALMRNFNETRGTAFLLVTHDPRLAARCDRVIQLHDGTIVSDAAQQRSE